jgi:hypothetical protein
VKKLVASLARGAPNAFPLVPAQVIVIVAFQAFASMALVSSLALTLARIHHCKDYYQSDR